MIKVTEIVNRRAGMSVEDFQHHWRHNHGPIVARLPGLRRYVQSHTRLGGYGRSDEPPFDGIAELWFDDKDAMRSMASTPEFEAAKRDEPNFIDTGSLIELVVDEHVIKDGPVPEGAVKSVEFVRFKEGMAPEEAQAYWRSTHGALAARIPTMSRYVQSHVRLGAYRSNGGPCYDGTAATWWDGIEAMRASAGSDEYQATRADEPNFIGGEPPVILTTEHIIVG